MRAVGLISPGDMGHSVGEVLIKGGLVVVTCLEGRSARTRSLADKAGIKDLASYEDLVTESDVIISIVPPAEALAVARKVSDAAKEANASPLYADCNAIAPSTMRETADLVTKAGLGVVDAGIIGPPPRPTGVGGLTRFYASGADASRFQELSSYGLDSRVISSKIGDASALKMVYAASTKGYSALVTELLIAAKALGIYENLIAELSTSQPDRLKAMERTVPSMPVKSRRWVGEMLEIAKTFEEVGLTPKIFEGAAAMFDFVGSTSLAEETPESRDTSRTLEEALEVLRNELRS